MERVRVLEDFDEEERQAFEVRKKYKMWVTVVGVSLVIGIALYFAVPWVLGLFVNEGISNTPVI